jgi:hypothetical protein
MIVEYLSVSKLEINKKNAVESLKIYNNPGNNFGTGLQAILTNGYKKIRPFFPSVLLMTRHLIRKTIIKALIRAR